MSMILSMVVLLCEEKHTYKEKLISNITDVYILFLFLYVKLGKNTMYGNIEVAIKEIKNIQKQKKLEMI